MRPNHSDWRNAWSGVPLHLPSSPFLGGDLPVFRRQPAGHVVVFHLAHLAHALLFGDAAGSRVGRRFGDAQDGKSQRLKPEVVDPLASFAHQALTLLRGYEPEAAVRLALAA